MSKLPLRDGRLGRCGRPSPRVRQAARLRGSSAWSPRRHPGVTSVTQVSCGRNPGVMRASPRYGRLVATALGIDLPLRPASGAREPDGRVDIRQGLEWRQALLALRRRCPGGRNKLGQAGGSARSVLLGRLPAAFAADDAIQSGREIGRLRIEILARIERLGAGRDLVRGRGRNRLRARYRDPRPVTAKRVVHPYTTPLGRGIDAEEQARWGLAEADVTISMDEDGDTVDSLDPGRVPAGWRTGLWLSIATSYRLSRTSGEVISSGSVCVRQRCCD